MRKASQDNRLRLKAARLGRLSYRTSAFSLAELVVSLGILVVMFALAGQVFNFTIQSTGQATAIVEINQQLRALEQTLRDDLANVEQGQSMMLIQGNPVNAYWTRDGKEADDDDKPDNGYPMISDAEREYIDTNDEPKPAPPRADILMFFTSRKANSYTDSAVTAYLQQVVYGHAELGEYESKPVSGGGTSFTFKNIVGGLDGSAPLFPLDAQTGYPSPTKPCLLPASEWHLARRSVLIAPTYKPRMNPPGYDIIKKPVVQLDDDALLEGATDIIASFSVPGTGKPPLPFDYERDVLLPAMNVDLTPSESPMFLDWQLPRIFAQSHIVKPYARSLLDVTPPPALANRLGHYMLPNCASFKVEWTLDPHSSFVAGRLDGMTEVLWFDPGFVLDKNQFNPNPAEDDPLQSLATAITKADDRGDTLTALRLTSLLSARTEHLDGSNYALTERFRSTLWSGNSEGFTPIGADDRPNTVAFVANRLRQTGAFAGEYVPDDIFPSALRITVDLYDRERRLDRPVRHVMVIPVGR